MLNGRPLSINKTLRGLSRLEGFPRAETGGEWERGSAEVRRPGSLHARLKDFHHYGQHIYRYMLLTSIPFGDAVEVTKTHDVRGGSCASREPSLDTERPMLHSSVYERLEFGAQHILIVFFFYMSRRCFRYEMS